MYTAILIVMIGLSNGTNIHRVKEINDGKYSYNTCQWEKAALIKTWKKRKDVVHLDIRCSI